MRSSVKSLISHLASSDQMMCRLNPRFITDSFPHACSQRSFQAVIDHINIRIHLCADTGSALGLYFGHFGSAFETEPGPPYVLVDNWKPHTRHLPFTRTITSECQPRHPTVVSGHERSSEELTCKFSFFYSVFLTHLVQTQSTSTRFGVSQKWVQPQI
jgi:hypothetical protein